MKAPKYSVVLPTLNGAEALAVTLPEMLKIDRDVRYAIPFLIQLGLFASPVVYPVTFVPERFQAVYGLLNPMAGIIEGFRWAIPGHKAAQPPVDCLSGNYYSDTCFRSLLFPSPRKGVCRCCLEDRRRETGETDDGRQETGDTKPNKERVENGETRSHHSQS